MLQHSANQEKEESTWQATWQTLLIPYQAPSSNDKTPPTNNYQATSRPLSSNDRPTSARFHRFRVRSNDDWAKHRACPTSSRSSHMKMNNASSRMKGCSDDHLLLPFCPPYSTFCVAPICWGVRFVSFLPTLSSDIVAVGRHLKRDPSRELSRGGHMHSNPAFDFEISHGQLKCSGMNRAVRFREIF